jgi:hypothetical protein
MTTLADLTARTPDLPCRTTDPEIFFSKSSTDREQAKGLCAECPIRVACAQYALDNPELRGVWGGTTAADRRHFRTGEPCRIDDEGRLRLLCGSERAYAAHFSYREQPGVDCVDGDCVAAHEQIVTAQRRARLAEEHTAGGSAAGFWIHRRLGEPPCEACHGKWTAQRRAAAVRRGARAGAGRARVASGAPRAAEALRSRETGTQSLAIAS